MRTKISLWDLINKKVYVKVKKEVIKRFFIKATNFAGSETKLAKLLGKKRIGNIWRFKNDLSFTPLLLIWKILKILPGDESKKMKGKIERNIIELRYGYGKGKSIKNPKFL